jgi:hypothetical protein
MKKSILRFSILYSLMVSGLVTIFALPWGKQLTTTYTNPSAYYAFWQDMDYSGTVSANGSTHNDCYAYSFCYQLDGVPTLVDTHWIQTNSTTSWEFIYSSNIYAPAVRLTQYNSQYATNAWATVTYSKP